MKRNAVRAVTALTASVTGTARNGTAPERVRVTLECPIPVDQAATRSRSCAGAGVAVFALE